MPEPRRYFLLGPTASGKTAVALQLAPRLGAEILSLDSMLVYRGMDLGTAKPTAEERAAVPHHLLDLVGPEDEFSVARWLEYAGQVEQDLAARGRAALYVGGTNLYLKALTAGLLHGAEVSAEVRRQVREEGASEGGLERLREELKSVDAASFARIHPNDRKRLLRAIEMYRATGRPLSQWQEQWAGKPEIGAAAVALLWSREVLRRRVEERFDQMLQHGLLDEIDRIRATGGFGPTAAKALGYRQMLSHLEGACSLEQAGERAVTLTRTYIRRQMTWLRSFPDLHWVGMEDPDSMPRPLASVVDEAEAALLGRPTPE